MPKSLIGSANDWRPTLSVVVDGEPRDSFNSIEAPMKVLWDNAHWLRAQMELRETPAGSQAKATQALNDAKAYGDSRFSLLSHTHTFGSLTSKPTTLAGYGITDAAPSGHTHAASVITTTSAAGHSYTNVQDWLAVLVKGDGLRLSMGRVTAAGGTLSMGGSRSLGSSWARLSTGLYRLTHNKGNTNYVLLATGIGGASAESIITATYNLQINTVDVAVIVGGVPTDRDFSFIFVEF